MTIWRHARNLPYSTSPPSSTWSATVRAGVVAARSRRSCGTAAPPRHPPARRARRRLRGRTARARRRAGAPGGAAPVLPTVAARSSTTAPSFTPSRFVNDRTARACNPVTTTRSTWAGVRPDALSAAFHACSPSGTYFVSPNRSSQTLERWSPGVRQRSRNSSVAVPLPRYSAMTGTEPSASPTSSAAAPSPPADSSGPVGRPVRRSDVTTKVVPWPSSAIRSAPTPERAAPPRSSAGQSVSSRSAPWIAVAFVLSRYAGSAVANQSWSTRVPPGTARMARRAGLDAHRRGVLVVRGHRAGALAPAGTEGACDLGALEAPVRHVSSSTEQSSSRSRFAHGPSLCSDSARSGSRTRRLVQ